ncbi:MAG: hypothetical protein QF691_12660, partial [SAR324 cluster bacterium]|nr:hypothetical protein [SAR324 cluster bacterium]
MVKNQIQIVKVSDNSYRYQFTAPLGDGSVSVQLHGQDPAGNPINQNPTSGGTWILDNTKPNGSVLIQSGNANSNNRRVGLQLQGTDTNGITGFQVSETNQQNPNGFTSVSSASNFSKNLNLDLTSSGDGTKTIYAWYRDHAGNIGGPFTDTIDLDTTKPILSFATDGSPPSYTNASSIKLNIQLTETSQVSLSGKCGNKTFNNQSGGELDLGSLSEGNYDDCVLNALDNAGNPSAGLAIPAFNIDRTVPNALSLILGDGASQTEMENITVFAKGSDQGGIQKFCVSEASSKPADSNACWKSVNGATSLDQSFSFSLSAGFNSKTVNLWVQDRAGNVSTKNDSILRVDPNKPPSLAKSWQENFQSFNDSNLDGQDGWKVVTRNTGGQIYL